MNKEKYRPETEMHWTHAKLNPEGQLVYLLYSCHCVICKEVYVEDIPAFNKYSRMNCGAQKKNDYPLTNRRYQWIYCLNLLPENEDE